MDPGLTTTWKLKPTFFFPEVNVRLMCFTIAVLLWYSLTACNDSNVMFVTLQRSYF